MISLCGLCFLWPQKECSDYFSRRSCSCFWGCAQKPEIRDSRTPCFGPCQRSRSVALTTSIAASGDENGFCYGPFTAVNRTTRAQFPTLFYKGKYSFTFKNRTKGWPSKWRSFYVRFAGLVMHRFPTSFALVNVWTYSNFKGLKNRKWRQWRKWRNLFACGRCVNGTNFYRTYCLSAALFRSRLCPKWKYCFGPEARHIEKQTRH